MSDASCGPVKLFPLAASMIRGREPVFCERASRSDKTQPPRANLDGAQNEGVKRHIGDDGGRVLALVESGHRRHAETDTFATAAADLSCQRVMPLALFDSSLSEHC